MDPICDRGAAGARRDTKQGKGQGEAARPASSGLADLSSIGLRGCVWFRPLPRVVGAGDGDGDHGTERSSRALPSRRAPTRGRWRPRRSFSTSRSSRHFRHLRAAQAAWSGAAKPPMAEFAPDPVSGKKVTIMTVASGPVTDGETNVTKIAARRGSRAGDGRACLRVACGQAARRDRSAHRAQDCCQEDDGQEDRREAGAGQEDGGEEDLVNPLVIAATMARRGCSHRTCRTASSVN